MQREGRGGGGEDRGRKRGGVGKEISGHLERRERRNRKAEERDREGRWNGCPQMADISDSYLVIILSHSDLVIV